MTDRELLELAAKAAGMRVGFEPDGKERGRYDLYWSHVHHQLVWHGKSAGAEYPKPIFWNPITDDGHAFRLAVKLEFCFDIRGGDVWVGQYPIEQGDNGVVEQKIDDHMKAVRRAIVRAAAEIGREMK